jgi:ATP-dependent Lon protease
VKSGDAEKMIFPEVVPVLPLRGVVVYPQTGLPLTIGQPRSMKLIDDVMVNDKIVAFVTSKDVDNENPSKNDLYQIGTIGVVQRLFRVPDGTVRILVQGLQRVRITEYVQEMPYFMAKTELIPEDETVDVEVEAMTLAIRNQFERISEINSSIPNEMIGSVTSIENALTAVYTIANFQDMEFEEAQEILELDSVKEKLLKLTTILTHDIELLEIGQKIQSEAKSEIEKMQDDYFLREQMKAIQRQLGENDEQVELDELQLKIQSVGMSEEAEKQAAREFRRLKMMPSSSAEYSVIRTYLDWLTDLPWEKMSEDSIDIAQVKEVLDSDHYGLDDIKERLLEFLSVRKLRAERKEALATDGKADEIRKPREGVILCFVGPPGVGKTSLGKSIARALGREFVRISLGGVHDEAEIRGHRRTYIGSMPGRIIQELRRVESRNPVFMLDEIDKLGQDYRGDPASALLEVLDPEQNANFRDHYLEVSFDLSQVMFITTANSLASIPGPLLDRMEIIQLTSYTEQEKIEIAKGYLIPRQLKENGLFTHEVLFEEDALHDLIQHYTREAGVRNLERVIGGVCRKAVTKITTDHDTQVVVSKDNLRDFAGKRKYYTMQEIAQRTEIPGVATGLAWTPAGGDVLFIEAAMIPGKEGFQLSGSLGNVMKESANAAFSFVRSHASELGIDPEIFSTNLIHIHVPAGATPKDGPSAGVTIATALVSLLIGKPVKKDLAMTGEITLRGQVLQVGGIKEKVLAAHRAGIRTVFIPALNEADLDELPEDVLNDLTFELIENAEEAISKAF